MNHASRSLADPDRFLKKAEILGVTGLSHTTIWRLESKGEFPKRRKISPNRVGWVASEVQAWLNTKINVGEVPV